MFLLYAFRLIIASAFAYDSRISARPYCSGVHSSNPSLFTAEVIADSLLRAVAFALLKYCSLTVQAPHAFFVRLLCSPACIINGLRMQKAGRHFLTQIF